MLLLFKSFNQPPDVIGGPDITPTELVDAEWLTMAADPHVNRCLLFEFQGHKVRLDRRRGHLARLHRVWRGVRAQLRRLRAGKKGRRNIQARMMT